MDQGSAIRDRRNPAYAGFLLYIYRLSPKILAAGTEYPRSNPALVAANSVSRVAAINLGQNSCTAVETSSEIEVFIGFIDFYEVSIISYTKIKDARAIAGHNTSTIESAENICACQGRTLYKSPGAGAKAAIVFTQDGLRRVSMRVIAANAVHQPSGVKYVVPYLISALLAARSKGVAIARAVENFKMLATRDS